MGSIVWERKSRKKRTEPKSHTGSSPGNTCISARSTASRSSSEHAKRDYAKVGGVIFRKWPEPDSSSGRRARSRAATDMCSSTRSPDRLKGLVFYSRNRDGGKTALKASPCFRAKMGAITIGSETYRTQEAVVGVGSLRVRRRLQWISRFHSFFFEKVSGGNGENDEN